MNFYDRNSAYRVILNENLYIIDNVKCIWDYDKILWKLHISLVDAFYVWFNGIISGNCIMPHQTNVDNNNRLFDSDNVARVEGME